MSRKIATCSTCACYAAMSSECHRMPPTPIVIDPVAGRIASVFTPTRPENWCGEHREHKDAVSLTDRLSLGAAHGD